MVRAERDTDNRAVSQSNADLVYFYSSVFSDSRDEENQCNNPADFRYIQKAKLHTYTYEFSIRTEYLDKLNLLNCAAHCISQCNALDYLTFHFKCDE